MEHQIDRDADYWLRRTGGTWIALSRRLPAGAQAAVDAGWLAVRTARGEATFLETTDDGRDRLQKTMGWPGGKIAVPVPQAPHKPGGRLRAVEARRG